MKSSHKGKKLMRKHWVSVKMVEISIFTEKTLFFRAYYVCGTACSKVLGNSMTLPSLMQLCHV